MAPPSPGRAESRDRPGIRVQLQPGGRGGAAAYPERCNPPLASGGAARPGPAVGKASPRDPWAPRPGGRGPRPRLLATRWPCGAGNSGGGGGGLPVRSCLARQKLASVSLALAERGTQTFRTSSISPGWDAASLPAPRGPESGPALPPLGSGAREPEAQSSAQPSSFPSRLGVSSLQGSRSPAPEGQTKLRLSNGGGGGVCADTQSLPYLAIGRGEGS